MNIDDRVLDSEAIGRVPRHKLGYALCLCQPERDPFDASFRFTGASLSTNRY